MLIRNAKDSAGKAIEVWLRDGKIAAVGLGLLVPEGEEVLDAKGRTVLPAFIDTHCHWRTPGFEYKEDISTGSAAAAAGGYTFVNLMPNTKPVCSSAEIAHAVEAEAARVGLCDANQTVSITKDFDGKTLDHLLTLPEDIKFITEDGNGVMNNAVMARAFAIATERGLTIMSHAEDREISPWDYRLAENIETVRNCHLAEYYGTRLHMCHVSTKESVDAIRMSRLRGARVSCEVTPHHLWFDDSRLQYKVNPPIRKAEDVTALIEAIYAMVEQHEDTCRVLIFQGASASVLQRMIDLARDESIAYWKQKLRHATDAELEMLYTHLSNGLMHVVVGGYDKYSREEVISFVNRIVKSSLSLFQ